jgi:hypothetical protein
VLFLFLAAGAVHRIIELFSVVVLQQTVFQASHLRLDQLLFCLKASHRGVLDELVRCRVVMVFEQRWVPVDC